MENYSQIRFGIAFCGSSGCGKTIAQILLRIDYDLKSLYQLLEQIFKPLKEVSYFPFITNEDVVDLIKCKSLQSLFLTM